MFHFYNASLRPLQSRILAAMLWSLTLVGHSSAITFTPLNYPGAANTLALAIEGNNIVGTYSDSSFIQHGFLFDGTNWTSLDVPFPFGPFNGNTNASGVSGNKVVGSYYEGPHGFLFDGTTWIPLDYPGSSNTHLQAVDGNKIVGLADFGFVYDGTTWTPLSYPSSSFTNPLGIDGDRIVGFYEVGGSPPRHGFVYDGVTWVPLNYPGSVAAEAHGVDGVNIVGSWTDSLQLHGFLYDNSTWQSFDYPNSIGTIANDISGNRIVGLYFDATGNSHSFLAVVPEPATWTLVPCGLLFAAIWRTHRPANSCRRIAARSKLRWEME